MARINTDEEAVELRLGKPSLRCVFKSLPKLTCSGFPKTHRPLALQKARCLPLCALKFYLNKRLLVIREASGAVILKDHLQA